MKTWLNLPLAVWIFFYVAGNAQAHIGERIWPIYEYSRAVLADIYLHDGTVDDWEDVIGEAHLVPTDLYQDPTVGDGAQYDPSDLDYRIWTGWNGATGTIWFAMERVDNVYFGREYDGEGGMVE